MNNKAFDLGNSVDYSVIDVIETAKKVAGARIPLALYPRRPGDSAVLIANSYLASTALGWQPEFSGFQSIIENAWQWQRKHPRQYR